jgi:hypothetical protein
MQLCAETENVLFIWLNFTLTYYLSYVREQRYFTSVNIKFLILETSRYVMEVNIRNPVLIVRCCIDSKLACDSGEKRVLKRIFVLRERERESNRRKGKNT